MVTYGDLEWNKMKNIEMVNGVLSTPLRPQPKDPPPTPPQGRGDNLLFDVGISQL